MRLILTLLSDLTLVLGFEGSFQISTSLCEFWKCYVLDKHVLRYMLRVPG